MMYEFKGRDEAAALGSFVAVADAFPTAEDGIRRFLKLQMTLGRDSEGRLQPRYSTSAALIDFDAIDPDAIDARRIVADCELLAEIATRYPDQLKRMVRTLQSGAAEGVEAGLDIARSIGLTEENATNKQGGFFFTLIVIGGGLLLAGCGGANREKVTSPAATTTPTQPGSGHDGGTGDGGTGDGGTRPR